MFTDPDNKLAACSTQKTTFAETVSFALAQETARTISRPLVSKVQKMEVVKYIKERCRSKWEKTDKRLNLNASTVERVAIFKETVKRHGKDLDPSHHQGIRSRRITNHLRKSPR